MEPLFTPPRNNLHVTSSFPKHFVERRLHQKDHPGLLSSKYPTTPSKYKVTEEYWEIISTLPDSHRVPEALIKIGFILREIHSKGKAIYIDVSEDNNKRTPTARVPSETITKLNQFLYKRGVEEDILTQEEKYAVGDIWSASNLNIPPCNASGAVSEDENRTYTSIEFNQNINSTHDLGKEVLDGSQESTVHTESASNRQRELDREVDSEDANFGTNILKDTNLHRGSR